MDIPVPIGSFYAIFPNSRDVQPERYLKVQYGKHMIVTKDFMYLISKKSPTGRIERTPKPEYLIALATCLRVRWQGPIQFLMENLEVFLISLIRRFCFVVVGENSLALGAYVKVPPC